MTDMKSPPARISKPLRMGSPGSELAETIHTSHLVEGILQLLSKKFFENLLNTATLLSTGQDLIWDTFAPKIIALTKWMNDSLSKILC